MALTCAAALSATVSSVASAIGEDPGSRESITYCYCNATIHISKKGCAANRFGALCANGVNIKCNEYQTNCLSLLLTFAMKDKTFIAVCSVVIAISLIITIFNVCRHDGNHTLYVKDPGTYSSE